MATGCCSGWRYELNLVSIGAPERDGLRFALARQSTTSTICSFFLSQSIGSITLLHARSGGIASIISIYVIISRLINI
jgi:hypothetical protein